ncbi:MAG TPA: acetyltransferase [Ferruginibacter sp.]|nr:acetyltransferase [Ferruginibacter sp.]
MILIGYSGHAFVVYGILQSAGKKVTGYCDREQKEINPFHLPYVGTETSDAGLKALNEHGFFIAIGDNAIRSNVFASLESKGLKPGNAVHASAVVDPSAIIDASGVMIAAQATINPLARIGKGAICNTGCIVEHECVVGDFAHIGPGAVLCGNVSVGEGSFVGANAVVRQGIRIGKNAMIGAGAVVVKDVGDGTTVVGVPAK